MKISPLPPLNSLVAFESAARHLSFTLAADELCVTQGAISRQIRLLESYLGRNLFTRNKRTIQLTASGFQYYHSVQNSLEEIAATTGEIRQGQDDRQITVATTNAMASLWLLPKISSFQRTHEDMDIRILASDQVRELNHSEFDIALFYSRNTSSELRVTPLFREEVFPVCSPDYLAANRDLEHSEQLVWKTLLYLEDAQIDWINWPQWFREVGLEPASPKNRIKINNYPMLVQAALNGQGIALAWGTLVDDYLANGTLVKPVTTVLKTSAQFCMFEPIDQGRVKPSVDVFRRWLLENITVDDV